MRVAIYLHALATLFSQTALGAYLHVRSLRNLTGRCGLKLPGSKLISLNLSNEESNDEKTEQEQSFIESKVRINDGGSDLSDRFKYKVNALRGVFDPPTGIDDERQQGNILNGELLIFFTVLTHLSCDR